MIPLDLQPFPRTRIGTFLSRQNRFILTARLGGRSHRCYLPNPGRLHELLLPGRRLWLEPGKEGGRTDFTAVAVEDPTGRPIILHTGRVNDIAQGLLERGVVPGLERATITRREAPLGRSRFDFLLDLEGEPFWLEVKSCTLLEGPAAMFPDAVSARGRRHLEELGELAAGGVRAGVLFLVGSSRAQVFAPDWHTDLEFARTFLAQARRLALRPLALEVDGKLRVTGVKGPLPVPLAALEREVQDGGAYLLLVKLARRAAIETGGLGRVSYPAGHYLYVGSARKGLGARIERHRRRRKRHHWHIDHLRERAQVLADFPVRSSRRDECGLARALAAIGEYHPPGFGSSDCDCPGHLLFFDRDPRHLPDFHRILGDFRSRALL